MLYSCSAALLNFLNCNIPFAFYRNTRPIISWHYGKGDWKEGNNATETWWVYINHQFWEYNLKHKKMLSASPGNPALTTIANSHSYLSHFAPSLSTVGTVITLFEAVSKRYTHISKSIHFCTRVDATAGKSTSSDTIGVVGLIAGVLGICGTSITGTLCGFDSH
jgi:hypothetical protein